MSCITKSFMVTFECVSIGRISDFEGEWKEKAHLISIV